MLTVKFEENRLTVITPITKEMSEKAFGGMVLRDEKTEDLLCMVALNKDGEAAISRNALYCNTIVDGKLAVSMLMPLGTTVDEMKKLYGEKIVNLNKHIDKLAAQVKADADAVDAIFADAK